MTTSNATAWPKVRTLARELSSLLVELEGQRDGGNSVAIVTTEGYSFVKREAYDMMVNFHAEAQRVAIISKLETVDGADLAERANVNREAVERVLTRLLADATTRPMELAPKRAVR
jgi:hypothetical protein